MHPASGFRCNLLFIPLILASISLQECGAITSDEVLRITHNLTHPGYTGSQDNHVSSDISHLQQHVATAANLYSRQLFTHARFIQVVQYLLSWHQLTNHVDSSAQEAIAKGVCDEAFEYTVRARDAKNRGQYDTAGMVVFVLY